MVEVETRIHSALCAAALIAFPDFQLDPTRYETIILSFTRNTCCPIITTHVCKLKLEFENLSVA